MERCGVGEYWDYVWFITDETGLFRRVVWERLLRWMRTG